MAGIKHHVYWDACVFIAYLKGDRAAEPIREGLRFWTDEARAQRAKLITSAITYTEVLRFHHAPNFKAFREFLRRYVTVRVADHLVCGRAEEYRSHFQAIETELYEKRLTAQREHVRRMALEKAARFGRLAKLPTKDPEVAAIRKLSTADAIHLATASLYEECTEFHTFDGEKRKKRSHLGLLDLNGQIPRFKVPIRLPYRPAGEELMFL